MTRGMANIVREESLDTRLSRAQIIVRPGASGVAPLAERIPDVAFLSALAVVPVAVGLSTFAALGASRAARGAAFWAGVGTAIGLGVARWQLSRVFTEEPQYTVEQRIGRLEVRRYPTIVRAETTVRGHEWRAALDEGFGRLARYIFGANEDREQLAMAAPVTTFRNDAHAAPNEHDAIDISFMMPGARPLATLPAPTDARILLVEDAPRFVAVLRYSGPFDIELTRRKQRELFQLVERAGLHPVNDPGFAGYDPPSTLPLLRRNEVWIDVEPPPPSLAP